MTGEIGECKPGEGALLLRTRVGELVRMESIDFSSIGGTTNLSEGKNIIALLSRGEPAQFGDTDVGVAVLSSLGERAVWSEGRGGVVKLPSRSETGR